MFFYNYSYISNSMKRKNGRESWLRHELVRIGLLRRRSPVGIDLCEEPIYHHEQHGFGLLQHEDVNDVQEAAPGCRREAAVCMYSSHVFILADIRSSDASNSLFEAAAVGKE